MKFVHHVLLLKHHLASAAVAFGLLVSPVAPTSNANAAGIADFLAGLCVTEGCTQMPGPYGTPVPVKYFLPKANCKSPAVILLHGSDGGTKYDREYAEVGKGLAAQGYAAFIPYYYEGAPGAIRPGPNDRALPDPSAFIPWVATVEGTVSFVQTFSCVDPSRIGLLGMSLGGFVGTSVAANDPRIRSVVTLSGGMPDHVAASLRHMPPTLIVHGEQDQDVPVWEAYKLHDRMARRGLLHDLEILQCEGHLPYQMYSKQVTQKVLNFFDKTL